MRRSIEQRSNTPVPALLFERLRLLEDPIRGNRKHVQKAQTPHGDLIAAKIFRPPNAKAYDTMSREVLASEELRIYKELSNSRLLHAFIPKPHSLIEENGAVTGLAVAWRDGVPLSQLLHRHYIDQKEVSKLQMALMSWRGVKFPNPDMLSSDALYYGESGFWFTSCRLASISPYKYANLVKQAMGRLYEAYVH